MNAEKKSENSSQKDRRTQNLKSARTAKSNERDPKTAWRNPKYVDGVAPAERNAFIEIGKKIRGKI